VKGGTKLLYTPQVEYEGEGTWKKKGGKKIAIIFVLSHQDDGGIWNL